MKLDKFIGMMTGHFDNKEQFDMMQKAGKIYPYAEHINTICNEKILNLPKDFNGKFVVEESYYETNGKRHASPHLFLITEKEDGIVLHSYEIPEGEDGWKKVKPYHAIILTQTQKGLRNLYELISVSHIQYFHKRPRVLQSVFEKYREGLILGSACEQGELYRAILHNKPEEKIEKIAQYYDYLEIQPLGNDNFLIRDGTVPDEEALKNINRKIVELGEKFRKLVVATCDVHFMDPQDEIYRRILEAGQGYADCDLQAPCYLSFSSFFTK